MAISKASRGRVSVQRFGAVVAAAALVLAIPGPAVAEVSSATLGGQAGVALDATGSGGVSVNGSAAATRLPAVTVAVPPPTTSASVLRLSNDAGTTWVVQPWSTSIAWSLIDPAAGGIDADGMKTVEVEGGDGTGPWVPIGSGSILLDRTGPIIISSSTDASGGPLGHYDIRSTDAGVGVAHTDVSLDGEHWQTIDPPAYTIQYAGYFDYRDGTIGGSWTLGDRTVFARVVDVLGNTTELPAQRRTVTSLRSNGIDDPPADFSLPLPAITGHTYTIAPTFDAGFQAPTGATCQWRLTWGDAAVRIEGAYDVTYGGVLFSVAPRNGVCDPWTFTLPYSSTLEYTWQLSINPMAGTTLYITNTIAGSFRATLDSTYRGIAQSNLPLYYVLPDRDYVGTDGSVTYRLYSSGGAPSRTGRWACNPADGTYYLTEQVGGTVFTCPVRSSGPWVATWAAFTTHSRWFAGYDPLGDRSRPVMSSLRMAPTLGRTISASVSAWLSWAGTDKGSGLRRYELQVSRDGGAWLSIALPSALATSIERSLTVGRSYRYRVRGVDRASNLGLWRYTATLHPGRVDATTATTAWSAGWTTSVVRGAWGGSVRSTVQAGAACTFHFTGFAVGIVGPKGPLGGWARIYVDGLYAATVNWHAASASGPQVVWQRSWTSAGTHAVRIVSLGSSGAPTVSIDAFAVLR
jgi:hypothetical protein